MSRTIPLHIDMERCRACKRCKAAQACRTKAILQVDPGEPPFLDVGMCRDCRVCLPACPFGAVRKVQDE